jgi:protein-S-isoprenylcysteine O-methyltransferase Ste14
MRAAVKSTERTLPALGEHGEGWVAVQLLLYAAVALTGMFGARWPGRLQSLFRVLAIPIAVAAGAMMVSGSFSLGRSLTPNPRPRASATLRQDGIYARVRHPIYGGIALGAVAWSLWFGPTALMSTILTGAFLDLKARREEVWLHERYPGYADYSRRVPRRFLPLG